MASTKLSGILLRAIEVVTWTAIIPVLGMILTFIGGSIYASFVIGR